MANKLKITFIDIPSVNDTIGFYYTELSTPFLRSSTFKSIRVNPAEVTIGGTINDVALNYYNAFLIDYGSTFNIIITDNIVEIASNNYSNIYDEFTTHSGSEFATFTYITETNIVLSRSPFNYSIEPGVLFDSAVLNMKLYRGELTVDSPSLTTYSLSKSVIQAGQSKINFEISKYLNDYCKNNIPTFGAGVNTSTIYDTVWCDLEIIGYYLGVEIGTDQKQLLAVDGFGWHTELYNPNIKRNVFSNINTHYVYKGSDYPLYFLSKDLVSITIDGNNVPFTLDSDLNNQIIAYVNIGSYIDTQDSFTAIFEYDTVTETHTIIIKEECRFPLYNCFFKNKFGFWQSIPFNLRSKSVTNVESNEYSPVTAVFGKYSLQSHNTRTYLPTSRETITLNTDYLPEEYNVLLDELMESEFVYLENDGVYLPVNLNKNSLEKKTRLFDKLIQYTFDFKYSFTKRNTVN